MAQHSVVPLAPKCGTPNNSITRHILSTDFDGAGLLSIPAKRKILSLDTSAAFLHFSIILKDVFQFHFSLHLMHFSNHCF